MTMPDYLGQLRTEWVHSYRRKLLLRFAGIVLLVLALLGTLLYRYLLHESEHRTKELATTVLSGLRHSMLDQDRSAIQDTVETIAKGSSSVRRVLILDRDSRVVFASDKSAVGKHFDRLNDPTCAVCHSGGAPAAEIDSVAISAEGKQVLRTVCAVSNEPACYGCHNSSENKLGVLIIDRSLRETYDLMVRTLGFFLLFAFGGAGAAGFVLSRGANQYVRTIENQGEELTSLYIMVERLSRSIDRKDLIGIVMEILQEFFKPKEISLVFPKDGGHRCLTWTAATGGMDRLKIETKKPLADAVKRWVDNPKIEPEVASEGRNILLPVTRLGRPLALALVEGLPAPFQMRRLWLLRTMADHFGAAFDNARLYSIAITDKLTSLYTRRHFDYCAEQLMDKADRSKQPFGLLMIDVDDFKKVNDQHGHPAGDAVLAAAGVRILESLRDTDLAFRYGGEEFAILLPNTAGSEGEVVARRILEGGPIRPGGASALCCTVSIGLAVWPQHAATTLELLQAADHALYQAKRTGKNRLVVSAAGGPSV